MPDPLPLFLSDSQLTVIMSAAKPLHPAVRGEFLRAVAETSVSRHRCDEAEAVHCADSFESVISQ